MSNIKAQKNKYMSKFYEGIIRQANSKFAFCEVEEMENPISIGAKYLKKSLTGDKVLLKVKEKRFGFVQKILERSQENITGQIKILEGFAFVKPWSANYYNDFFIPLDKTNNAKDGDIVEIKVIDWVRKEKSPKAEVVKTLYQVTSEQYLMYRLNLPTKFPDEVLEELNDIKLRDSDYINRVDLRNVDTFSIDPEGSKDLDDAISIERSEDGFKIGIHIADVTHYVKPGSLLDREAYKRGYTVYLPQTNIPMLPSKLSSNLCSLIPDKDRLSITIMVDLDNEWNIKEYDVYRSVIRNKKQFTYEEAEVHRNDNDSVWNTRLNMLYIIGQKIRSEEFPNEIELNLPEVKWLYDSDGEPQKVKLKNRIPTMDLIQSWMLLANKLTTKKINSLGRFPWIYRTHKEIYDDNIVDLKKYLKQIDVVWDDKLEKHENIKNIIADDDLGLASQLIIKKFRPAKYSHRKEGHFAIGTHDYAHFTSPIRRYADILAHRILLNALCDKPIRRKDLSAECKHLSDRERVVDKIEKNAVRFNGLKFMKNIDYTLNGRVLYFSKKGILIKTELMIDGWITVKELEGFNWSDKQNKWINKDYNINLGDIIEVDIDKLDWDKNEITLKFVKK